MLCQHVQQPGFRAGMIAIGETDGGLFQIGFVHEFLHFGYSGGGCVLQRGLGRIVRV